MTDASWRLYWQLLQRIPAEQLLAAVPHRRWNLRTEGHGLPIRHAFWYPSFIVSQWLWTYRQIQTSHKRPCRAICKSEGEQVLTTNVEQFWSTVLWTCAEPSPWSSYRQYVSEELARCCTGLGGLGDNNLGLLMKEFHGVESFLKIRSASTK
jgi:hypothetical protein